MGVPFGAVQSPPIAPLIQPKLKIGAPNDRFEQEADRVAEQVMRMPDPRALVGPALAGSASPPRIQRVGREGEPGLRSALVQRMCTQCDETLHRQPMEEEEEAIQAKGNPGRASEITPGVIRRACCASFAAVKSCGNSGEQTVRRRAEGSGRIDQRGLETRLAAIKGRGRPLPATERSYFEPRLGADLGGVQIHTGSLADGAARAARARAFTLGRDVVFRAGEFNPGSSSGRRLLAHELVHTLQQGGPGRRLRRWADCSPVRMNLRSCPRRRPGEIGRARRRPMEVGSISGPAEGLFVGNFAVGASAAKRDLRSNTVWTRFARQMASRPDLHWEVLGFTDCQGGETLNSRLRAARAQTIRSALPAAARAQGGRAAGAPATQCVTDNTSEADRARNRSAVIVRTRQVVTFDNTAPVTVPAPFVACYDGTTVHVSKSGRRHSCSAITGTVGAPTPNGAYCIRVQGAAQRHRWYRRRNHWYLLEPLFSTTRSRMHLHPGSASAGCVTVSGSSCFGRLAAILNSGGRITATGYDGYPPGNSAGVRHAPRTVTCVGRLKVDRRAGACSFLAGGASGAGGSGS